MYIYALKPTMMNVLCKEISPIQINMFHYNDIL